MTILRADSLWENGHCTAAYPQAVASLKFIRLQHHQRAAVDNFDALRFGLLFESVIFRTGIKKNSARFCGEDFINERIGALAAEIHRHRVNRTWHVGNEAVAGLAK